jgi:SAM-dependent methyltransferase
MLIEKFSPEQREMRAYRALKPLKRLLSKDVTFMEIGPGDCALSLEVCKFVKRVYAADVCNEITKGVTQPPPNFQLIVFDGISIPLPPQSVHVAYSDQLMEHLHPDDAFEQLKSIYECLAPRGIYICMTPNRLSGPHDISMYFDETASGFHLREYTTLELAKMFKAVQFSEVQAYVGGRGRYIRVPVLLVFLYEKLLEKLPHRVRRSLTKLILFRLLLGIRLIGIK